MTPATCRVAVLRDRTRVISWHPLMAHTCTCPEQNLKPDHKIFKILFPTLYLGSIPNIFTIVLTNSRAISNFARVMLLEVSSTKIRSSPPLYLRFRARALASGFGHDTLLPEHVVWSNELTKPSPNNSAVSLIGRNTLKSLSKQEIYVLI